MVDEAGTGPVPAVRVGEDGLLVGFRVSPNAKRTRVLGLFGDRVKVQVGAPPEDGRANAELRSALARWLDLPAERVVLYSGEKSRDKVVAFRGVEEDDLRERLARLLAGSVG